MNQQTIERAITLICNQGCVRIRVMIQQLENGMTILETTGLNEAERQAVLAELKNIMAIYDLRK